MVKIKGNWLLLQIVVVYTAFWILGSMVERPFLSNLISILATIAGIGLAWRYLPQSYRIVFQMVRGENGAHHAIVGVAEFALGLIWQGIYRLVWHSSGRPEEWAGTAFASFGLFLVVKGVIRLVVSPSTIGEDVRLPEGTINFLAILVAVILGVVIGRFIP